MAVLQCAHIITRELRAWLKRHLQQEGIEHSDKLVEFMETVESAHFATKDPAFDPAAYKKVTLRRNTVRELSVKTLSIAGATVHQQLNAVYMIDDMPQAFVKLIRNAVKSGPLAVLRCSILCWLGRCAKEKASFLLAHNNVLEQVQQAHAFLERYEGPCGDGKTAESRFYHPEAMSNNAQLLATVYGTFGEGEAKLVTLSSCVSRKQALDFMRQWRY